MKTRSIHLLMGFSILCLLGACGKSSNSPAPAPVAVEEKLVVKLSAASIETALSNSFNFTVEVQSKMPTGGVTIKVDVKREDNNTSVYSIQANSTIAISSFTINPLPPGQVFCTATITVTSVTTPTNIWSGSFRVLWK